MRFNDLPHPTCCVFHTLCHCFTKRFGWNIWGRCVGCGGMWGHLRSAMFLGLSSYCRSGDHLGLWGRDSVYSTEWSSEHLIFGNFAALLNHLRNSDLFSEFSRRSKSQRYIQHMMGCSTPAHWFCVALTVFHRKKMWHFWNCFFFTCFVFCQKRSCFPFRSVLCWLIYSW